MNKKFILAIKITCSTLIILYILYKLDLHLIYQVIINSNHFFIGLVVLIGFINNILCGWRWWYLNEKIFDIKIPFWLTVKIYFMGSFFNLFLPTSIGGDGFKAQYVYRYTKKNLSSINSIIIDRFTGLIILGLFCYLGFLIAIIKGIELPKIVKNILYFLPLLTIIGSLILFTNRKNKLFSLLRKFNFVNILIFDFKQLSSRKKHFVVSTLITILFQFLTITNSYIASLALGLNISFIYFLIIVPIVGFLTLIPITFSGAGIREIIYIGFFSTLGLQAEKVVIIPLLIFVTLIILGGIGGLLFVFDRTPSLK